MIAHTNFFGWASIAGRSRRRMMMIEHPNRWGDGSTWRGSPWMKKKINNRDRPHYNTQAFLFTWWRICGIRFDRSLCVDTATRVVALKQFGNWSSMPIRRRFHHLNNYKVQSCSFVSMRIDWKIYLVGCGLSVVSADQLLDLCVESFHWISGLGTLHCGWRHWDSSRLFFFIITGWA